jgi:tripartite-type tricarboxylate transporter receptor subunit TctC
MRSLFALVAAAFPVIAAAQAYPTKPIRTLMGVQGGVEVMTRLVAQKMAESMGQPVIVEIQAGAGGAIGAEMTARAAPDGYTILFGAPGSMIARLFTAKDTHYDPVKDFTPIIKANDSLVILAANAAAPVSSLAELIVYAKKNPGRLSYGSSGVGTGQHLAMEMVKAIAGLDIVHVPYKGGGPAMIAAVTGEVPLATGIYATAAPQVASGKVKLLAVLDDHRFKIVPNLPAVSEAVPGFEGIPGGAGYLGPPGLPPSITRRLYTEILKQLNDPEVRSKSEAAGLIMATSTPEEFGELIKRTVALTAKAVKIAGVRPE